jgi:hypothetical protein
VHVTVPGEAGRPVRRGVKAHVAADGMATTRIRTFPITTPVQTALGWRLIIVTAADLYDAPEQVLARVRHALIERRATGIRRYGCD